VRTSSIPSLVSSLVDPGMAAAAAPVATATGVEMSDSPALPSLPVCLLDSESLFVKTAVSSFDPGAFGFVLSPLKIIQLQIPWLTRF